MEGKYDEACEGWRAAIDDNRDCLPARLNLGLVEAELSWAVSTANSGEEGGPTGVSAPRPIHVAVLSFLFNWPSTGGGNMHTAGLVEFLGRDGYDVRHFFARYPG